MRKILLTLVLTALATPALATDGVLEINQTCATGSVNTGCFSGDGPGFPVTIDGSAGKSYRLTSSLKLPNGGTTGIELSTTLQESASGTTIDLNGFTIGCFPAICPAGAGRGITANVGGPIPTTTVRIHNGTVQGVGSNGIELGTLSIVENVTAVGNRGDGIMVGDHSTVVNSRALSNELGGIRTQNGSTVSGNTASLNGSDGIFADAGSTVSRNTAYQNGNDGIEVGAGSTVSGNTTSRNGDDGINSDVDATIIGNTSFFNSGYGLRLNSNAGYRENVVSSNTTGAITGFGVDAGANVINGVLTPTP